jgi:hypothetical protein
MLKDKDKITVSISYHETVMKDMLETAIMRNHRIELATSDEIAKGIKIDVILMNIINKPILT